MNAFFDVIRKELFGGRMSQAQVNGVETLLAATVGADIQSRAYLLATAFHETAFTMQPIHERGSRSYFDKYEPQTAIGKRLGNTRPGDGFLFRGRGYVQLTGRANYLKASKQLGVDLVADPELALRPDLAAKILVQGCAEGWFTGKKLEDFDDYMNMRRVVNGTDRAEQIAGYAREFEKALRFLPDQEPIKKNPQQNQGANPQSPPANQEPIKKIPVNPGPALEPLVGHKSWLASVLAALADLIDFLRGKK